MSSIAEIKEMFITIKDLYDKGQAQDGQAKLLELRDEILSLKEENINLREEMMTLREKSKVSEALVYEAPFYFNIRGDERDGPYCQRCYDAETMLVRLIAVRSMRGSHHCKKCDTYYGEGMPPPQLNVRRG